ncbi:MAG: hypothetical protein VKL41_00385 [Snowella sp.]|nr:hypothetical protein [Snowella sp.]
MKKLSRLTLIAIANIILPTFSSPSLAAECPTIPKDIKEVTVKNNSASLRKEPIQNSEKGFVILENDRLKVLDPKPAGDKNNQNYCWYQVGSLKDTSRNKYWIAHVGIKEFENFSANISNLSEQNNSNSNQAINFSILIIFIGLGALSVSEILFSLYCVSLFKEYDKQIETLQENLEDSEKQIKNIQNTIEESTQQITNQFNNQFHLNTKFNQLLEIIKNTPQYKSLFLSPQIKELVTQFNHLNRELFNDSRFQPLKLTQQSTQRQIGLNVHRVIELESVTDNSQASFLKFEIDGENWLFPNITSPYISQIMRNLGEYTEFFIIHPGSEILQLIRPAKLKNIGSNLWGIEELGEFTQQDNSVLEIDLSSFHHLPFQNITTFSPETINPKEIDLGILYYLRKNDNASFIDLLSNLQCDKQHLRDRLLILQEEEFIKIVNKADENNTVYKMI